MIIISSIELLLVCPHPLRTKDHLLGAWKSAFNSTTATKAFASAWPPTRPSPCAPPAWPQIYVPRYLLDIKKSVARAVSEARADMVASLKQQDQQQQHQGAGAVPKTHSKAQRAASRKALHPSIEDVARRAGVSAKAVRELLNATSLSLTALMEGGDGGEDAGFEDAQLMKVRQQAVEARQHCSAV